MCSRILLTCCWKIFQLGESAGSSTSHDDENNSLATALMASKPLCTYRSHTADVLDLSWSRNYFILSSGMDRTVKLWHLSRPECLCCFQHMDFVTCIAFMPKVRISIFTPSGIFPINQREIICSTTC